MWHKAFDLWPLCGTKRQLLKCAVTSNGMHFNLRILSYFMQLDAANKLMGCLRTNARPSMQEPTFMANESKLDYARGGMDLYIVLGRWVWGFDDCSYHLALIGIGISPSKRVISCHWCYCSLVLGSTSELNAIDIQASSNDMYWYWY